MYGAQLRRVGGPLWRVYPRVYGGTNRHSLFATRPWLTTVYPRVYGGTSTAFTTRSTAERSAVYPRVYGGTSPIRYGENKTPGKGSIPACTGEPPARYVPCMLLVRRVYPRVYGGTSVDRWIALARDLRSIPACAGEPMRFHSERHA